MAITFNVEVDKNRSFYNHGANWVDGGVGATFDYFDDAADVDDATYFNMGYYSYPNNVKIGGIRVYVGTPLVADSITTVWEYSTNYMNAPSVTTWSAFSNVTDGTNSFQNSGDCYVTWDMPTDWQGCGYLNIDVWKYYTRGFTVRCRITAISNPSEGGANSTNTVKKLNYAITINDGGDYTMSDVMNAETANGWGVVTQEINSSNYRINANIYVNNGSLTVSSHEQLTIGTTSGRNAENYNIEIVANGTFQLGKKDADGYSYAGASLVWHTGCDVQYPYWSGNFNCYNSNFWIYTNYIAITSTIDILDSNFQTPSTYTWYFAGGSSGTVKNSTFAGYWIYMYSGLVSFDNVTLVKYESGGNFYGILAGGGYGKISNTDMKNSLIGNVTQASFLDLLDCINMQDGQVQFGGNYTTTNTLQRKYSFDLTILDSDGNAVEDAVVTLQDQYGRSALYWDLSQIQGTTVVYYLSTPTDTVGTISNYGYPYLYAGDKIKILSENLEVVSADNSNITVLRNQSGSLCAGVLHGRRIWRRRESSNTDASGKLLYDTDKTFEVVAHEYAQLEAVTKTPVHYAPFTLTISKTGYETYTLEDITLTEAVDWTIVLKEQNKTRKDIEGNLYLAIHPETGSSAKLLKL